MCCARVSVLVLRSCSHQWRVCAESSDMVLASCAGCDAPWKVEEAHFLSNPHLPMQHHVAAVVPRIACSFVLAVNHVFNNICTICYSIAGFRFFDTPTDGCVPRTSCSRTAFTTAQRCPVNRSKRCHQSVKLTRRGREPMRTHSLHAQVCHL